MFLFVTPSGGKLWRWKYRFDGKEKLMALGKYPDVSLAQARERHSLARKLLAEAIDPMAKRKAERSAVENTFQHVAMLWLEHWRNDKEPRHVGYVERRLASDVYPHIGARPIAEIQAPELVSMALAVQERGALELARRALRTTGQIFRYAVAHGITNRNPAAEFQPKDILKPTKAVNYARIDARELSNLLKSIEVYQGTHVTRLAMKLMAMTFLRTSERIGAKWSEFDFENARWNVPEDRMKMGKPHIVPLARQALDVLQTLHTLTGHSQWVFPGAKVGKSISNNTILKALERMGYKGIMTGHGFRGLASTILHEQGYDHDHIELQLAHAPRNAVSAAYNHARYLEPRAKMMQDWADYLERRLRESNVIPLHGRAA